MTLTQTPVEPPAVAAPVPALMPGDRLDAQTFLARYSAMPDGVRAELIEGLVYMPPPGGPAHGRPHGKADYWLNHYEGFTPGVTALTDTTAVLGRRSVPQPDVALRIEHGGQTRINKRGLVVGCPELVVEVANSTESIDLHAKRRDYDRRGALEYVVVLVRQTRVVWFRRDGNARLAEAAADSDGLHRSGAFPGLWLDAAALLAGDVRRLAAVVEQGVATPEHAAFAADLAARRPAP